MRDFVIITETTADLPASYIEENGLVIAPLYYQIDETVYGEEKHMELKEFFLNGEFAFVFLPSRFSFSAISISP